MSVIYGHVCQSCIISEAMRPNSAVLWVTRVSPFAWAMAAIMRSFPPIKRSKHWYPGERPSPLRALLKGKLRRALEWFSGKGACGLFEVAMRPSLGVWSGGPLFAILLLFH